MLGHVTRLPRLAERQGKLPLRVDENLLYYGDNLDVLRRHVKDEEH